MSPKIRQIRSGAVRPSTPPPDPPVGSAPRGGARDAIGLLELTSVAKGVEATDIMLKAADVELLGSRSICSGKYMVLVRGDVAACTSSVQAGGGEKSGECCGCISAPGREG